eukprot:COSAG02_NODE_3363_length_6868_cov_6.452800_1_plen_68_part_00
MPDGTELLDVWYADDCQYVVMTACLDTLLDVIDGWVVDVGSQSSGHHQISQNSSTPDSATHTYRMER